MTARSRAPWERARPQQVRPFPSPTERPGTSRRPRRASRRGPRPVLRIPPPSWRPRPVLRIPPPPRPADPAPARRPRPVLRIPPPPRRPRPVVSRPPRPPGSAPTLQRHRAGGRRGASAAPTAAPNERREACAPDDQSPLRAPPPAHLVPRRWAPPCSPAGPRPCARSPGLRPASLQHLFGARRAKLHLAKGSPHSPAWLAASPPSSCPHRAL
ncbi:uncharacterized protein LOC133752338 [Lepus europaeus]|uniref:uncharacterized protein LOC133752338 n=1 Tax=Lepus europaeus TaxID=9983 RepID=UPI002B4590A2|nr:uncharacterized protein LOC133752338 [Lepus europaeus]